MKTTIGLLVVAAAALTAGSAVVAAPPQDYTARPGDPTPARVWIQNVPLTVELHGTPTVTLSPRSIVQAQLVRQAWEYRILTIASGMEPARAFANEGADGWEAAGVQFQTESGTSVLFKRPR